MYCVKKQIVKNENWLKDRVFKLTKFKVERVDM